MGVGLGLRGHLEFLVVVLGMMSENIGLEWEKPMRAQSKRALH